MEKSKPGRDHRPIKRSTWGVFRVDYAEVRARNLTVTRNPSSEIWSSDTSAASESATASTLATSHTRRT